MILAEDELFSVEDLRLTLEDPPTVALTTARHAQRSALTALGLSVRAVHEGEPACDWCGSSEGHAGLVDESQGGPPSWACEDAAGCMGRRARHEAQWADEQHPGWHAAWHRVQDEERRAARVRLTQRNLPEDSELTAAELVALTEVRELVERGAWQWLRGPDPEPPAPEPEHQAVELAAPPPFALYDQGPPAPFAMLSPERYHWGHTLRGNPAARMHTMGHQITHPGPCGPQCAQAHVPDPGDLPSNSERRRAARRKAARRHFARL